MIKVICRRKIFFWLMVLDGQILMVEEVIGGQDRKVRDDFCNYKYGDERRSEVGEIMNF